MAKPEYTVEDQERMTRAENYFAWQGRLVRKHIGRRVVEVGCGLGNFTRLLLDRDLVVAVDSEPGCVERLEERFGHRHNLVPLVCDASHPSFRALAEYRLDCCICLNVLEHIEHDETALEAMVSVLTRKASIILVVPAFQLLYGPIDRNLGHYRRYSRRDLRRLARGAGVRVKELHYSNLPGFFGWWMNSHIYRREAQSERQIAFFDRYVVPTAAAIEGAVRPPFGQSLVAVLEKP